MNLPLSTLLCSIAFCSLCHGQEQAKPLVIKPAKSKTTLLMGSGKEGDSKVYVHIMRGSATLHVVFDKDKQIANTIELSEQNSVTITAHAVGVEAKSDEVLGFYQIEPPKAPVKPGGTSNGASNGQNVRVIERVRPGGQADQEGQDNQDGQDNQNGEANQ